ncbi:MAG: chromate efflux transporter [Synechococcaceae cyanobacterium RL_1_2]|nr:chromate efflux transporter [Synechococcaceae cyanobacterium RL_1_2]
MPQPINLPPQLPEIAKLFLRLGITAFGGPAAHIAMMHDEVVKRRKWLDEQQFLDILGATNLIPGPNSTEMAIHLAFVRGGWWGLIVGGSCFIIPAVISVMILAWAYTEFGSTPQAGWLLSGVKPVVIAVIVQALWKLGQKALKKSWFSLVGLAVVGLYFWGVNEIALLLMSGGVVMVVLNLNKLKPPSMGLWLWPLAIEEPWLLGAIEPVPFSLPLLFVSFVKIGAVLYGSGYVLLAFLHADFVEHLGWLTDQQLMDAVAIGQITPGPVFTTATFVGYLLGGVSGSLWATIGIFLPSFLFVALSNPIIPRIRNSQWVSGLLDGVNVASLGLMAAVTVQLAQASIADPITIMIAVVAGILLMKFKVSSGWLILGGGIMGLVGSQV